MPPATQQPPLKPTGEGTLENCLLALLRGIQDHLATTGGEAGQAFREKLAALETRFQGKDNAREIVDAAVEVLNQHAAQAQQPAEPGRDEASRVAASDSHLAAGPIYAPDQLTGLPGRAAAEADLARAHGQPEDCYVALFIVKRLALINAKFGYSRGDQVLLKVVVHLAQAMPDFNNLYRWAPCAFITTAPPGTSYKQLRAKVQHIELTRMTPTLEWEGHTAMVPMAIDCRIVSVKDFETPSDLFLRLDTLAADA
jgi:GGDEF domain-containing protein